MTQTTFKCLFYTNIQLETNHSCTYRSGLTLTSALSPVAAVASSFSCCWSGTQTFMKWRSGEDGCLSVGGAQQLIQDYLSWTLLWRLPAALCFLHLWILLGFCFYPLKQHFISKCLNHWISLDLCVTSCYLRSLSLFQKQNLSHRFCFINLKARHKSGLWH